MCIQKVDVWGKFKLHTVYMENLDLRQRLNKMIIVVDNTSDVFSAGVQYQKRRRLLIHRVKNLLPTFLKKGYFQGIKNLTRQCT